MGERQVTSLFSTGEPRARAAEARTNRDWPSILLVVGGWMSGGVIRSVVESSCMYTTKPWEEEAGWN